jgi:glycosyltransferase involved in cell wall biosynthesis
MSSRYLIYVSYDRFPAPKGAATHIRAFVEALASEYQPIELVTVADETLANETVPHESVANVSVVDENAHRDALHRGMQRSSVVDLPPGVTHTALPARGVGLIERVMFFRAQLHAWWGQRRPAIAHVRSIYEGYPIACNKSRYCERLVFEVNGLPSIELKYHYPAVADDRELMRKLIAQEQRCLQAADLVVTVSDVNAAYLRARGVNEQRLVVIPNGVDLELFKYQTPQQGAASDSSMGPQLNTSHHPAKDLSLLYSGTWAAWQGVQTAIEALALYRRDLPARLTIVGDGRPRQARALQELAYDLGVAESVQFVAGIDQAELAGLHHAADVVLAPLLANDRNMTQGCCPLKVLEAMASGTPLVASNLPVVAALARNEIEALLVAPGSAKGIKDALLRLTFDPELGRRIAWNARQRVAAEFTWQRAQASLLAAYRQMLESEPVIEPEYTRR